MDRELARAKVNLTLHVGRPIEDRSDAYYRYHPLDSLVVFAGIGDVLTAEPASETSLNITGPFSAGVPTDDINLILKACRAVSPYASVPPLEFHLEKNLPISAGVGGGSANAAAALRILKSYIDMPDSSWSRIALNIGADVPVCLASNTSRMTGIGGSVTPLPGLGHYASILVNPRVAVSTADIFRDYDRNNPPNTPQPQAHSGTLLERAFAGHNDLQATSTALQPVIGDVIAAIESQAGCQLSRMTGSGATCFGLFDTETAAQKAAETIKREHLDWWCVATQLGECL